MRCVMKVVRIAITTKTVDDMRITIWFGVQIKYNFHLPPFPIQSSHLVILKP